MPLIYVWSLGLGGVFISAVAAWFSVTGLAALFSGASLAVGLMAAGLEFAKLVMASFLYRAWDRLHFTMRAYMTVSVIMLSILTSGGIFGFLSNAFQKSSLDLNAQQIKVRAFEEEQARAEKEMKQIQALIDAIPADRITRKINITREWNPRLDEQRKKRDDAANQIRELNLSLLKTNTEVGPLIFVSKAFNIPIETIAKYLILIFVSVFDPLAICLVVATSASIKWREEDRLRGLRRPPVPQPVPSASAEESYRASADPTPETQADPEVAAQTVAAPVASAPQEPSFAARMEFEDDDKDRRRRKAS